MDEQLKRIYYDISNPASFGSPRKLYNAAKRKLPDISLADVKRWLSAQVCYTLHKPAIRKFKRAKVIACRIDEYWMADLTDMSNEAKYNDGYRYLLCVIDVLSKFAWVKPIKNKSSQSVLKAFKEILSQTLQRIPEKLQTDKGKEFNNPAFRNYLKSKGIRYFTSENEDIKCSVVERFIRTLKTKLFKYFTAYGTKRYLHILDDAVAAYNNTHHRTIKMKPSEVNVFNEKVAFQNLTDGCSTMKEYLIREMQNNPQQHSAVRLEPNANVRISKHAGPFKRGFLTNWTDEVFRVRHSFPDKPIPVHEIKDESDEPIKGRFYPQELQKIEISDKSLFRIEKILRKRKRGTIVEVFVKWLGYPERYNSWIPATDVIQMQEAI